MHSHYMPDVFTHFIVSRNQETRLVMYIFIIFFRVFWTSNRIDEHIHRDGRRPNVLTGCLCACTSDCQKTGT